MQEFTHPIKGAPSFPRVITRVEGWPKEEVLEWACNSRRGLEWPGSWNPMWGPMPEGYIKERCGIKDCHYCGSR